MTRFYITKYLQITFLLSQQTCCVGFRCHFHAIKLRQTFLGGAPTSICHFFRLSFCPSVHHTPYLRNSTLSDHNFLHTYVKWLYLQVFFLNFFKILIFWAVRGKSGHNNYICHTPYLKNCTSSNHNFSYTRRGRVYRTDFCQGLQILHLGFLFQRLKHNNTDFRQKKESLSFSFKYDFSLKSTIWKPEVLVKCHCQFLHN